MGQGSVQVKTDDFPALDSKARVELFHVNKTEASLRRKTEKMGARFVSHVGGTWTFDVDGFGGGKREPMTRHSDSRFGAVTWKESISISQEALAGAVTFA